MLIAKLTAPGAPFSVTEASVDGHRIPVYAEGPRTLPQLLADTREFGDAPFLVSPDSSYSYAGHHAAAASLAARMLDRYGLRRGDRVAIVMRNHPEWQIAFWAVQLAGLIAVPLNSWWSADELAVALADCTPALLVVDGERVPRISPWRDEQTVIPWLLTVGHDGALVRQDRFEDLPEDGASPVPDTEIRPVDDAAILYTSGTTGRPKGVVLTHRNFCGAALNGRWTGTRAVIEDGKDLTELGPTVALMTFPFFHVAAFTVTLSVMTGGGTLVLLHRWDIAAALEAIVRHRVSTFTGVPATALQLLDALHTTPGHPALGTLAQVSTGGAAAPPELVRRIGERFAGQVAAGNGYGLTETCGGVIGTSGERYRKNPGSVGAPSPVTRVRITGPEDAERPEGEIGELQLLGQTVFRGYWENPAATAAAFAGGWFRTGDLAYVEGGEVYVVDRIKDVVIRGGENVYCGEVESVLFEHPEVADAAVLGVPDPVLGEEVAALVVPRTGALPEPESLRAHVATRLAAFKVPTLIVLRERPLPRNATGKVLKRELRAELAAAVER
ncbi:class I adenylate-forming enzyme family protein [Streptomyces inhibens]|uniref:class I adenylate-forming enzyme family protein n=1 Tax=Streptomyces inhibens TaxID=2293571 RepID=UPI00402AC094